MDNLNELQNIWQGHQPEREIDLNTDKISESVLEKIKKTENKVYRINIVKSIAVSMLSLSMVWFFRNQNIKSIWAWLGICVITIDILVMMILYWKIQFKGSNLNHDLPQNEFINDAIYQMKKFKSNFQILFAFFVAFLIVGINLLYLDLLKDLEFMSRLSYHLGITAFLLLSYVLGLKIRKLKFKKDFQLLIDKLESIKD